jgi:DNA-binding NarL/FixJ family response regulator
MTELLDAQIRVMEPSRKNLGTLMSAGGHPARTSEDAAPRPWTIVIAEDHQLFRQLVRRFLEGAADFQVIGEARDGLELLALLETCRPHLVIMDITMPRLPGIEATRRLKAAHPDIKVLVLTMHRNREYCEQALEAGANGYLLKEDTDTDLIGAIRQVLAGGRFVSPLLTPF